MVPIKTGPSPQQPEMKSQESSINLHLGLIAYKCLTMFFLFETSTSNISENPKVDMERNPLLHQKFYVQPIGMCHFWFSPLPHGKTWAFCTPEILGFQNLHFGVFSLGYISPIPQRIDWIFFVGGRLIWDDALDWMFFLVLFWESWEMSFFMFFCAYAAVSWHTCLILVWLIPFFSWLVRYLPTQVHLVSYRWTWCSPTFLSTCHGHHTTQLHSAFLPNVTWMAQKFRWRKGHPSWPLHSGIQLK